MTRRENQRSRRAPVREERTQVLVVCGGVATEPAYFRGLRHLPRYAKSGLCFQDFASGVDDAVERARSRCAVAGTEHTRNPSTGVWALVLKVV